MSPSSSKYPAAAWRRQLEELLPPGLAWTHEVGSLLIRLLAGIAVELWRVTGRGEDLLEELSPAQTVELLEEWVELSGVRACFPRNATAGTVARELGNPGGQSIAYFIQRAADLGFVITIDELTPFVVGTGRMGQPINIVESRFVWRVTTQGTPDQHFRMGMHMGNSLRRRFKKTLECPFEAEKPAHTSILWNYTA